MGQMTTSDGGPKTTSSLPDIMSGRQFEQKTTSSLFKVPGLLVGLAPKCVLDYDSVKSPTSPLELKIFSNLGSSFRSPNKPNNSNNHDSLQKCWECDKVGLGILDSLGDDAKCNGDNICGVNLNGKTVKPSNSSKNILFGPQIRTKTTSSTTPSNFIICCEFPKDDPIFPHKQINSIQKGKSDVFFEIVEDPLDPTYTCRKTQSFSLDSKRMGCSYIHRVGDNNRAAGLGTKKCSRLANGSVELNLTDCEKQLSGSSNLDIPVAAGAAVAVPNGGSSSNKSLGSLSAREIELSEDYTRVITRGTNPKTTHIFGGCVLESHTNSSRADFGPPKEVENVEFDGVPVAVEQKFSLELFQPSFPSTEFLSFCYFCHKKLEEGKDIYMYRGEKAFCSLECRLEEILIEEGKEKSTIEEAPINESPSLEV